MNKESKTTALEEGTEIIWVNGEMVEIEIMNPDQPCRFTPPPKKEIEGKKSKRKRAVF